MDISENEQAVIEVSQFGKYTVVTNMYHNCFCNMQSSIQIVTGTK